MARKKAHTNYDLSTEIERDRLWLFLLSQTRIDPRTQCWLWTGRCVPDGYGKVYVNGKQQPVHRFAYLVFVGPADGLLVRHKCDVRNCWNLSHIHTGTPRDNAIDCVVRGRHNSGKSVLREVVRRNPNIERLRDVCIKGHPYTMENVRVDHMGYRRCRECCRINRRKHRAMNRKPR